MKKTYYLLLDFYPEIDLHFLVFPDDLKELNYFHPDRQNISPDIFLFHQSLSRKNLVLPSADRLKNSFAFGEVQQLLIIIFSLLLQLKNWFCLANSTPSYLIFPMNSKSTSTPIFAATKSNHTV